MASQVAAMCFRIVGREVEVMGPSGSSGPCKGSGQLIREYTFAGSATGVVGESTTWVVGRGRRWRFFSKQASATGPARGAHVLHRAKAPVVFAGIVYPWHKFARSSWTRLA